MISSESSKYWANNRGWISTKFSVKNPVSHFLKLYKVRQKQSKSQVMGLRTQNYFSSQKVKPSVRKTQKTNNSQVKLTIQSSEPKPQTAPHNYTLNSALLFDKEIQQKSQSLQNSKRNRSLHIKRAKKVQQMKELTNLSTVVNKINEQNEANCYSQRNFKATNYGKYKPQMRFLVPQFRASTASAKAKCSNKPHEQLERKKAHIYSEIHKSLNIEQKIHDLQQYKRATPVSNYQPIEYMTEYGCEQNREASNCDNENQPVSRYSQQKTTPTFKRKPNLSVLRNKLNLQYKKSSYKNKIVNMNMEPEDTFEPFEDFV